MNVEEMRGELRQLEEWAAAELGQVTGDVALQETKARLLGKSGRVAALMTRLREVPKADKPAVGAAINETKERLEALVSARGAALKQAAREADLAGRPLDLTLPGRVALGRGHPHPLVEVREELLGIFRDLGFEETSAPEVELELNNFTRLAFPPDHPATDMQDSFWVEVEGAPPAKPGSVLLRTHTSNSQVRAMMSKKPPMACVSAGPVYRRDDDATHSPMFHQIEAFLVDEGVSFTELEGVIVAFLERLYGKGTPVRFRPSYFPFVEPGAEVDCGCVFCKGAGCRLCKGTGFIELMGCGMIHPDVFRHAGLDPERWSGFALGLGTDRVAMLRYGIPHIRLLFENDPRMLAQF